MSVVTVEAPTDPDDDDEGVFETGQNFAPDCCARVPGHGGNCATADELRAQWRRSGAGPMSAEKSVLSKHRCRCDECAAERTSKQRREQARRLAGRELIAGRLVHPLAVHGTTGAYTHWGCRCTECREAAMDAQRAKRAS